MSEDRIDWQQRTGLLLGEEKMERLRNAHVLVVGLGGVGAYAAEMLCRAGVGRMTIVDADTVQYQPPASCASFHIGEAQGGSACGTLSGYQSRCAAGGASGVFER